MTEDDDLVAAFRAGLQRRADDADAGVDLLEPVTSAARGRRRRRVAVIGGVGLVAAGLVTAVVVQTTGGASVPEGPKGPQVVDGAIETLPTGWRVEAWHGLQIEVPADWGWGTAPTAMDGGRYRCGGPVDGTPYVGRPVMASDACIDQRGVPLGPYVWLGVDLEPGDKDLGGGYVQTTVEAEGTTVTVASRDAALRDHVIASAAPVTGCSADLPGPPVVESMLTEGLRDPSSAQVCAYAPDDTGTYDLVYATSLDSKQASVYHSQVYDGGFEADDQFCRNAPDVDLALSGERVLITITGDDPYGDEAVSQTTVVDPSCREVSGSPGVVTPLSDQGMKAWAVGGLPVTLRGLIGMLG